MDMTPFSGSENLQKSKISEQNWRALLLLLLLNPKFTQLQPSVFVRFLLIHCSLPQSSSFGLLPLLCFFLIIHLLAPPLFSSLQKISISLKLPLLAFLSFLFFLSKFAHPTICFFLSKNALCFSSKLHLALAEKPHFFLFAPTPFSSQNIPCFSSSSSFSHSFLNEAPLHHPSLNSSPGFLLPYFSLQPSKPPPVENLFPIPLFFFPQTYLVFLFFFPIPAPLALLLKPPPW